MELLIYREGQLSGSGSGRNEFQSFTDHPRGPEFRHEEQDLRHPAEPYARHRYTTLRSYSPVFGIVRQGLEPSGSSSTPWFYV